MTTALPTSGNKPPALGEGGGSAKGWNEGTQRHASNLLLGKPTQDAVSHSLPCDGPV